MGALRFEKAKRVLAARQWDVSVILDRVHKTHNVSAILRTCDAVGVPNVYITGLDERPRISSYSASGSDRWVETHFVRDGRSVISAHQADHRRVYAAHWSDKAQSIYDVDLTQPFALVMGAEKFGVSDDLASAVDGHIFVPMFGMVESLNVSVACALILFEMARARAQQGGYQLDQPVDHDQLFEWLHPKVARLCREKGEAYPDLDGEGDIHIKKVL